MITQLVDLLENVRVALEAMMANKLRTALTMLGVIIGVAAVIALMSIGEGAQVSITQQISSMGTNMLVVVPMTRGRVGERSAGGYITMEDYEALADPLRVPDAELVVPEYNVAGQIIFGDTNFSVNALGTTPDYRQLHDVSLASGVFLSERELDRRAKVVVLGYQVAQDLFGDFEPVGQKIKFASGGGTRRTSLTVIGVLQEQGGSMFADIDNSIFVPLSTAQTKLANARNSYGDLILSRINVRAISDSRVDAAYAEIEEVLQTNHGLTLLDDPDYRIISQADMLEAATTVTDTLTVFLGAIAGIALIVGGIGIMNIMLVSVTERTREIGLRKAIGARRSDILAQFLLESVILSLLGGGLGVLVGIGAGQIVNMTGLFTSVVTPESVLLAVGFSFVIGLFFGIYPANQASKLNPIEALRYE